MRDHSFTESHDPHRHDDAPRPRGVPGRTAATAQLAPRPAVLRAAAGPDAEPQRAPERGAAAAAPSTTPAPTFEDPFGMHLACEALDRAASGPSSALPEALRAQFGGALGKDLADVRLHTDETAAVAASAFSAKALTVGNDIYFAAGAYDPASAHGQHLLAHEVAHTAQQAAAPTSGSISVSSPGDACEVEADHAADAMLASSPSTPSAAAPLSISPTSAVGRVVMRSPDEGSGGAGGASGSPPPSFDDDGRGGEHGSTGSPDPSVEARGRERARAELASHGKNWLAAAGRGAPVHLDEHTPVPQPMGGCPPSAVDETPAPEWYQAFRASWAEVSGIHGDLAQRVTDFIGAAQNAQALGLSRDANNSATAGWRAPSGPGTLEKYAGEQGPENGPTVGEMWKGGSLDPSYGELSRGASGFSPADEELIQGAISNRQLALDGVLKANVELEVMAEGTAKSKLQDIHRLEVNIEKFKLSADNARGEQQLAAVTRERDAINAKIAAAMTIVDGLVSFAKLKSEEARKSPVEQLKAAGTAASTFVNLDYSGKINDIASTLGGIKVALADKDVELALIDKIKMTLDYQAWLKLELAAKGAAVRTAFTAYKLAQEKVATTFRNAAINKTKAAQKAKGGAPGKDAAAEEKAAGDKAEAVVRALAAIDTVIGIARNGVHACREPGYSRESGIGFAMAGSPAELPTRVTAIRGYRAGFQEVEARWRERRQQVATIVDSHAL
jgi:Domain of unknown function (DUF4157)